jgi:hypothetical protein
VFLMGLAALAGVYRATGSAAIQWLTCMALSLLLVPASQALFGRDPPKQVMRDDRDPALVLLLLALAAAWFLAALSVRPFGLHLGPWFGFWLFVWPTIEVGQRIALRKSL